MGSSPQFTRALMRLAQAAFVALAATPTVLYAHDGGLLAHADVQVSGNLIRYSLTLTGGPSNVSALQQQVGRLGSAGLAEALAHRIVVQSDNRSCRPTAVKTSLPGGERAGWHAVIDYRCPDKPRKLAIHDDSFELLGADLHTLGTMRWEGGERSFALATEQRDLSIDLVSGDALLARAGGFFGLGIEHILTGYDHLLFLAALLLRTGTWLSAAAIISTFTVAHSVTLALAALGFVAPQEQLVEAVIAASIAVAAAVNLLPRGLDRIKWITAFSFGLVHGLGFSSALKELLPPGELVVWRLLQFNLGVEAGQLALAVAALAGLATLRRRSWSERALRVSSVAILASGLVLLLDRLTG